MMAKDYQDYFSDFNGQRKFSKRPLRLLESQEQKLRRKLSAIQSSHRIGIEKLYVLKGLVNQQKRILAEEVIKYKKLDRKLATLDGRLSVKKPKRARKTNHETKKNNVKQAIKAVKSMTSSEKAKFLAELMS